MKESEIIIDWLKSEHRKEKKLTLRAIAYYEVNYHEHDNDNIDDKLEDIHMIEMMMLRIMKHEEWVDYMKSHSFIDPRIEMSSIESHDDLDEFLRDVDKAMKRPTVVVRTKEPKISKPTGKLRAVPKIDPNPCFTGLIN